MIDGLVHFFFGFLNGILPIFIRKEKVSKRMIEHISTSCMHCNYAKSHLHICEQTQGCYPSRTYMSALRKTKFVFARHLFSAPAQESSTVMAMVAPSGSGAEEPPPPPNNKKFKWPSFSSKVNHRPVFVAPSRNNPKFSVGAIQSDFNFFVAINFPFMPKFLKVGRHVIRADA